MEKCQCGFAKSIVGDGCRYCQPQTYIDKIHDQIEEERKEVKDLVDKLKGYEIRHKEDCKTNTHFSLWDRPPVECTCGLAELLGEME